MEGKRFIRRIYLKNLLSYGEHFEGIDLEPLNVLIGPNGSGKSNLIEAISLLAACPTDLAIPFRRGGGVGEWIWKGEGLGSGTRLEVSTDEFVPGSELHHVLELGARNAKQFIEQELVYLYKKNAVDEKQHVTLHEISEGFSDVYFPEDWDLTPERLRTVRGERAATGKDKMTMRFLQQYIDDRIDGPSEGRLFLRNLARRDQSVLSQLKLPSFFPELAYLGKAYSEIRIYRGWGPAAFVKLREPARFDLDADFLSEDAANLANILRSFDEKGVKPRIIELVQRFFDPVTDITTTEFGGLLQILLQERGLREPIPAARLSDGTLQYLTLLAILCHPDPPPLICIEEPELGLHPDIIPTIAELLIEASARTQLIVTTHSADLISALGDVPEAVVVCEREAEGTVLRRLEPEKMKKWLEDYTLGHLWATGELGGNRW